MGERHADEALEKEVGVLLSFTTLCCSESSARHHINEPVENVDWGTEVMIAASGASAPTPTTDEPTDGGTSYI